MEGAPPQRWAVYTAWAPAHSVPGTRLGMQGRQLNLKLHEDSQSELRKRLKYLNQLI
jgi:hypothetical protein